MADRHADGLRRGRGERRGREHFKWTARGRRRIGKQFRVTKQRGTWVESELAQHVTATIHPSSILRQRTDEDRHRELDGFVEDLKLVASVL